MSILDDLHADLKRAKDIGRILSQTSDPNPAASDAAGRVIDANDRYVNVLKKEIQKAQ
jgi:hypothetical protein